MVIRDKDVRGRVPGSKHDLVSQMSEFYPHVTALTAVGAFRLIGELHRDYPGAHEKTMDGWKKLIDRKAADTMAEALSKGSLLTVSVGSEGKKEVHYAGEAAASIEGSFGNKKGTRVWAVSDVVEGTTPASRYQSGASSVIAVSEEGGIMRTPEEDAHYMVKLIAPPQAHEAEVSLKNPHEKNLGNLIDVLGIKPDELTQVTMNPGKPGREINIPFVDAARRLGVRVELIDVGDFMPGVKATLDPDRFGGNPMIVVGRGGFEEGTMAAASARALGGFMEAQVFDKDPERMAKNPIWGLDQLVPATNNRVLVAATFITPDNQWFRAPGVREIPFDTEGFELNGTRGLETCTMVIDHLGLEFRRGIHLPDG